VVVENGHQDDFITLSSSAMKSLVVSVSH